MEKTGAIKVHFTIVVVFLIGVALGFSLGLFRNKSSSGIVDNTHLIQENSELKVQLEKAKKYFPNAAEMLSVSGVVKSINGNILIIDTGENPNPFEELPSKREVVVTSSTKIIKIEPKDVQQAPVNSSGAPPLPPSYSIEKQLKLSDIKVNDLIMVESNNSIKTSEKFEATKITVRPAIESPNPAADTPSASTSTPPAAAPPPPQSSAQEAPPAPPINQGNAESAPAAPPQPKP